VASPEGGSTGSRASFDTYQQRLPSKREEEIVHESMREFAQLQSWRAVFAGHWNEVAQLILPTSSNTFFYSNTNWPGQKKTQFQVDSTGAMALEKFAAICDSLLTPRNMIWHGLKASNDYVMKDRPTRLWFEQATKALFDLRYAPEANFTTQNTVSFTNLGAFGNQGMFVDELDITQYPFIKGLRYKSMPMGELFIRENHQGMVDGFVRWFKLSARQAWQKWGDKGTFPDVLRPALTQDSELLFDFIHRVVPRTDYDPERIDERGKPYASYYLSMTGKNLLSEGGYRTFPAAISRYAQAPGEVYGRSPAMMVLPSLKTLNAQKRTFLKVGHREGDPVLLTTDDGVQGVSLRPGAMNPGTWSADGKPLIGVLPTGKIQTTLEMMNEEKALIQDAFMVNLFQLALNLKDMPTMTATQVIEIMNQKGILLGPTVGNQQSTYVGPLVMRELDVAMALGKLPPMPPRLREARGEYQVVYSSPLARAMQGEHASGFMRAVETSKELINITQDPSHLDWANLDVAMPAIARMQNTLESWINTDDTITAKRRARAQAAQQQAKIQALPAQAAIMKAQAVQAKAGIGPGQAPAQGGQPLQQQLAA
jgi:hypothetical protein